MNKMSELSPNICTEAIICTEAGICSEAEICTEAAIGTETEYLTTVLRG